MRLPRDDDGVRHPALIAALIVIAAAGLRLIFFSGIIFYDDYHYVTRAHALSQGQLVPPIDIFGTRLGVVVPAAVVYRLFGVSKATTAAYPFVCSLLGVVAAYVFGRRLFGTQTGLLAAALLAVFPMDVLYATTLFATAPVTLLVGVSLGLFLLAEQERRWTLSLASGLVLGAAILVHETVVAVLVFYPVYALLVARPSRAHLLAGLGVVAVAALDPVFQGLLGNAWARFAAMGSAAARGAWMDAEKGLGLAWMAEPVLRLFTEQELGLFPWVLLPVALLRLRGATDRNERAVVLFFAVVTLWLLYGTASPFRYAPLSRQPRYLAPVVLAAMLLLAHDLVRRRWRTRALVTGLLVVTSIASVALDGGRLRVRPFEEARAVLAHAKAERVVVDPWLLRFPLLFVEGFTPRYSVATLTGHGPPPAGAFVVMTGDVARERVATWPGAERIASIPQPEGLYLTLLRNPAVVAVLRATRPAYRMRDLNSKAAAWSLEIYRVP